jgi:hypothetical protein
MGYVMCSVMRFYGITHADLLRLPIYTFWEMAKNIDRLRAEDDKRMFILLQQAFMSENAQKYLDGLHEEQGTVIETSDGYYGEKFDQGAFNALRGLLGG